MNDHIRGLRKVNLPPCGPHYKGDYYDSWFPELKCRRCRHLTVECLCEFRFPDEDIPLNVTTSAVWKRSTDKDLHHPNRKDHNACRRRERQGLRTKSASYNIIENPKEKIRKPSVQHMFLQQIVDVDATRTRYARRKMVDVDNSHITEIVRRPEAKAEEPRDYDVYHKLPNNHQDKMKTIEVYKTYNHKFPKTQERTTAHDQMENINLAPDWRVREHRKKTVDLGTFQVSGLDRKVGDLPEKGYGSCLPDPDPTFTRFQRTYNDHYRVPIPYNEDRPHVSNERCDAYRMQISKFTDLGNSRPRGHNKYLDQTAFYENKPQRRARDPISNPIGEPCTNLIDYFGTGEKW